MTYRPVFRQIDEDIEKKVSEIVNKQAQSLKEEITGKIDERTKPFEEIVKTIQEEKQEKQKESQERDLQDKINKLAEEKARKLAEDMATKLADEKAKKLAGDIPTQAPPTQVLPVQTPTLTPIVQAPLPQSPETSSKIAKMIEDIKKRRQPSPSEHVHTANTGIQIPIVSPDQVLDDGIKCPTCHKDHVHSVEPDGVTYKCTGPNCGKEYVMVDKTADYKCVGCGGPIKRPEEENIKMESCPFCKGKKAVKFDWGKVWKVQKPTMSIKR